MVSETGLEESIFEDNADIADEGAFKIDPNKLAGRLNVSLFVVTL